MPNLNRPSAAPQACLFDLDGLLLDTEPLHARAWSEAAAYFGTQLTTAQLLSLQGRRRLDNARQVCSWLDSSVTPDQLLMVRQPIAVKLLPYASAIDGAEALISSAQRFHIPIALVTSSDKPSVMNKITHHPWLGPWMTMVCGDDPELKAGKPEGDPYLLAAKRLNVQTEHCWAFEDSEAGTQSALTAGCIVWKLINAGPLEVPKKSIPQQANGDRLTLISNLNQACQHLETLISTS
ncbi:HAD family phosphatase [Synechococcus sp. NOUM97013]|uniref:HAD family hydrolase n=1 Tax=Synechococcus sp. NOUM97013 TaxID=1442555 RepID=UPI001646931C|nr:HAD family phosphatase [Synechococcus sp. NOUM97013]QNI73252.1 HAD hydrolase/ IA/ variant 3 family protein [Synechococcus sp. NOUM97013]